MCTGCFYAWTKWMQSMCSEKSSLFETYASNANSGPLNSIINKVFSLSLSPNWLNPSQLIVMKHSTRVAQLSLPPKMIGGYPSVEEPIGVTPLALLRVTLLRSRFVWASLYLEITEGQVTLECTICKISFMPYRGDTQLHDMYQFLTNTLAFSPTLYGSGIRYSRFLHSY